MTRRATLLVSAVAAALAAGCTTPRTELIVVSDTDLAVPDQLDRIVFEVVGPEGQMASASADPAAGLPAYLGVVHSEGALSPVEVRVLGRLGGLDVVERRARTAFQKDRTLVLPMNLFASCAGAMSLCSAVETCAESGCRPVDVDESELLEWDGTPAGLDGGMPADAMPDAEPDAEPDAMPDTGGCPPPLEMGSSGCTDLSRDPLNCGSAGNVCPDRRACIGGSCVCRPGLTDAGGTCVDLLTDPANCGAVGNACSDLCRDGSCSPSCGSADACGGGCTDTDDDALNCGACGDVCASNELCEAGTCVPYALEYTCTSCPCTGCSSGGCRRYPQGDEVVCTAG
jgi:hypothetical protein